MTRFLPPLLVVAALGLVVFRVSSEPRREEAQRAIEAGWEDPKAIERLVPLVDRYQRTYVSRDDKWFAAKAWLRLRMAPNAIHVLFGALDEEVDARDARRFAELALKTLGWEDEARTKHSFSFPIVNLALVEGGDAEARSTLERRCRTEPLESLREVFYAALRRSSRGPLDLMARAFRERGLRDFSTAAAMATLAADPYPEREADIELLVEVVTGDWRTTFNPTWSVCCIALGRSEDPRGVSALNSVAVRLEGSTREQDRRDLALVRLGLIASGDWTQEEAILPLAFGQRPDPLVTAWYLEAVIYRHGRGDARARLQALWGMATPEAGDIRERMGMDLLLLGEMPGPDVPVESMLTDLQRPGGSTAENITALAYRVRRGDPGARAALLRAMLQASRQEMKEGPVRSTRVPAPFLNGIRALYLYR